ncbi:MAG: LacI family DNA-binding transcriptional regulator [Chloroflexi bacterium]|nr:LacI family DNA-binding transcriptional regulator [Chloroflexota bacterium]
MSTIYDVAKLARVSPATVSNAYNRPHLIKPATHQRILAAAQALNYTPNVFAKALAGGKTQMMALLVPDIRYPYTATVVRGIEEVLTREGYLAAVSSTDGRPANEQRLLEQLTRQGVGGFILVPAQYGLSERTLAALEKLTAAGVPVVLAGEQVESQQLPYVAFHSQEGTREIVDYLIQLGHRRIAFVGGRFSEGVAVSRWLGYQESLANNEIEVHPDYVIETDLTPADGAQALAQLLDLEEPPTAVFALNDLLAMGMLDLCYERHLRLPDHLSLVSFDYQPFARRTTPAVTSVVVPAQEIGQHAAELLIQRQQEPDAPIQQIMVGYRLAVRQTTAVLDVL